MDNQIVWEKWRDPFLGYDENDLDVDQEANQNFLNKMHQMIEDEEAPVQNPSKGIRVIATPMGIIPYNEYTASGKIFNFWIGHTNFSITEKVADIIEQSDGVETLDIFTRYRFRIAIGKIFEDSEVKKKICDNVYAYLKKE